jgi:hypothetical protein
MKFFVDETIDFTGASKCFEAFDQSRHAGVRISAQAW